MDQKEENDEVTANPAQQLTLFDEYSSCNVGLDGEVTSKVGPSLWRLFYESIEKLPKFKRMKTAIVKAKEEGNTLE